MRTTLRQRLRAAWGIATGAPNEGLMWRCVWGGWALLTGPCSCPRTGEAPGGVRYGACGWVLLRPVEGGQDAS